MNGKIEEKNFSGKWKNFYENDITQYKAAM